MDGLWRAIRALIALQICACYATPNGLTLDLGSIGRGLAEDMGAYLANIAQTA